MTMADRSGAPYIERATTRAAGRARWDRKSDILRTRLTRLGLLPRCGLALPFARSFFWLLWYSQHWEPKSEAPMSLCR